MIDVAISWYIQWVARSQLAEADRLDAQAEAMKRRAEKLRHEGNLFKDVRYR